MYEKKLGIWHNIKNSTLRKLRNKKCTENEKKNFFKNLREIGYNSKNKILLIEAFQRRFRQSLINGKSDKECLLISKNLLKSQIINLEKKILNYKVNMPDK